MVLLLGSVDQSGSGLPVLLWGDPSLCACVPLEVFPLALQALRCFPLFLLSVGVAPSGSVGFLPFVFGLPCVSACRLGGGGGPRLVVSWVFFLVFEAPRTSRIWSAVLGLAFLSCLLALHLGIL